MKKLCCLAALCLILSGCGVQETFETIPDICTQEVSAPPVQKVALTLPDEAATPAMTNGETNAIYLCDGYTVAVQTMDAGNLDKTFRQTTGFGADGLTVMQTSAQGIKRYDCVWTAAGEGEDQICRAVILDDGNYHYAVTVMGAASSAGKLREKWQTILDSACLVSIG